MVYTDIYIVTANNVETKKDGVQTLSGAKDKSRLYEVIEEPGNCGFCCL